MEKFSQAAVGMQNFVKLITVIRTENQQKHWNFNHSLAMFLRATGGNSQESVKWALKQRVIHTQFFVFWFLEVKSNPRMFQVIDHDELCPTLASDCFLTFNLVSSCAWVNMAMLWISALMYTSRLEEQASASCGN